MSLEWILCTPYGPFVASATTSIAQISDAFAKPLQEEETYCVPCGPLDGHLKG